MKFSNHLHFALLLATLSILLSGCVAVDSRAWKEPVDKVSSQTISGQFLNSASYRSETMGFVGSANFSDLIDLYGSRGADTFSLSYAASQGLTVELYEGSNKVASKTFKPTDGLTFTDEGKIELFSKSDCGGRDSPGFGCMSKTVTLFVNPAGDLVTVQSGGGAGVLGIFPIGIYGKLVAIFPRAK